MPQLSDSFFVGCHGPREEEDDDVVRGCTGSCFCGEECEGCILHVMQPGLLGAAHSLINKAAVPTVFHQPLGLWGSLHLIPSSALWGSKSRSCHIRARQLLSVSVGNRGCSIRAGRGAQDDPPAGERVGSACLCTQ